MIINSSAGANEIEMKTLDTGEEYPGAPRSTHKRMFFKRNKNRMLPLQIHNQTFTRHIREQNTNNLFATLILSLTLTITGCTTSSVAPLEEDKKRKSFSQPPQGYAGLYIYRNSIYGGSYVYINNNLIGALPAMAYFYQEIPAGEIRLSTAPHVSDNDLLLNTESGKNYFVRQYIEVVVFSEAKLTLVSERTGMNGVIQCRLESTGNPHQPVHHPSEDYQLD